MVDAAAMKRPLVSLAVLIFVGALAGCNNPTGVGGPCTTNSDCELGQACNTAVPGGFCTHGCSFEGAKLNECPSGSICTSLTKNSLVCAPTCTAATECRDQYDCSGTGSGTIKACKPK